MHRKETVIVGGGIAGLYSALLCSDSAPNQQVTVYEASGRWGGNIATYYNNQYQYEMGAGRFNEKHVLLNALIRRFGLTPVPIRSSKHSCELLNPPEPPMSVGTGAGRRLGVNEMQGMTYGDYLERYYPPGYRKDIQEAFGYDAEFDWLNADDAIRMFQTDFRASIQYYYLKEGLTELIRRMVAELESRPNVRLYRHHPLMRWEWNKDIQMVYLVFGGGNGNGKRVLYADALVLALPKEALLKLRGPSMVLLRPHLDGVKSVPLHRIYGRFTQASDYPDKRTTTRLPIRQYIPMNPEMRLAMVSYSDTRMATYWHRLYAKDPVECKEVLEKTLTRMFQSCKPPGVEATPTFKLRWIRSYYWSAGVHVWKAGVSSEAIAERVRFPLGHEVLCFIVGEAYSRHQGWIEGALQSVKEVTEKYL